MQASRPWMESLIACVPDPLAFLDSDGTIFWANREFSEAVGVARSLKGVRMADVVEAWASIAEGLPAVSNRRAAIGAMLLRADGERIPVRLHAARCAEGVEATWSIHLRDVQEVTELRQRLGDRERSHSFLQANTSDMIVRTNEALEVTWTNESAATIFPIGQLLANLVESESLSPFRTMEKLPRFDVLLRSATGRRPMFVLQGIARRLTDDQGATIGFSLLLRDDSDRFRLERFASEYALSAREEEVVEHVVKGYSNLNIATILGLSESGVKFHIRNVFSRAKVNTRTELMALLLAD